MKMLGRMGFMVILLAAVVTGCSQVDSNKSIDEIKKEVETMNLKQLESKASAYVKEISNKSADMDAVKKKLSELSPKDLLGEKAKEIKNEVSSLTTEVSDLTKRYNVYADQFKKLGGDVSKIQLA